MLTLFVYFYVMEVNGDWVCVLYKFICFRPQNVKTNKQLIYHITLKDNEICDMNIIWKEKEVD